MQRIITVLVLGISMFCFTPLAALGQENPNYFNFKAGAYSPTDDLDDGGYDTGFNGEIAYGYRFNPHLALEGGIGYFDTELSLSGFDFPIGFFTEDDEISVTPLTCTIKGIIPAAAVDFYGGGGLGLYFADFDGDVTSTVLGADGFNDSDVVAGVHFVLGLNVNVTDNFFLGVEGKYILTGDAEFEDTLFGFPIMVGGNLNGYTITGGVGFRF